MWALEAAAAPTSEHRHSPRRSSGLGVVAPMSDFELELDDELLNEQAAVSPRSSEPDDELPVAPAGAKPRGLDIAGA